MRYFKNKFFLICLTVALCLTVFSVVLSASGHAWFLKDAINVISTPFRSAFNYCADGIQGFVDYFTEFDRISKENEELRKENEELKNLQSDLEVLKEENAWLRDFLDVDNHNISFDLTDATVIGKNSGSNFAIIVIASSRVTIDFGFRLPSAYDNRPLKFEEFEEKINQAIFVSATPADFEKENSTQIVEQIIRPTGLVDPEIIVRPIEGQVDDLMGEIKLRAAKNECVLVTTLTKKMAEDLTEYFENNNIKVRYIHYNVETMERMEIIRDLRLGVFDVLVGINLLREGLDIPEVSLVAILDADKEGFLRAERSLIQTIGRAARNAEGKVIMYADTVTRSMRAAITETNRRREIQDAYNKANGIIPKTVVKGVRDIIEVGSKDGDGVHTRAGLAEKASRKLSKTEREKLIAELTVEMKNAAQHLEFEKAAYLRDEIKKLREGKIDAPRSGRKNS